MVNTPEIFDEGGRVYLRALTVFDVTDKYISWFQDAVVTEFLESKRITRQDAIDYVATGWRTRDYFMYGVIHRGSGEHIGNLKLGPVQWNHMVSDLVTVIGCRDYWGQGLAVEAIKLGKKIAFDHLGLRKLSAGIVDGNVGSVKAYTGAGWVVEGRMKGQHLINGEARDRLVIACFNPQFFPSEVGN